MELFAHITLFELRNITITSQPSRKPKNEVFFFFAFSPGLKRLLLTGCDVDDYELDLAKGPHIVITTSWVGSPQDLTPVFCAFVFLTSVGFRPSMVLKCYKVTCHFLPEPSFKLLSSF
jgi:hypothetical protein